MSNFSSACRIDHPPTALLFPLSTSSCAFLVVTPTHVVTKEPDIALFCFHLFLCKNNHHNHIWSVCSMKGGTHNRHIKTIKHINGLPFMKNENESSCFQLHINDRYLGSVCLCSPTPRYSEVKRVYWLLDSDQMITQFKILLLSCLHPENWICDRSLM